MFPTRENLGCRQGRHESVPLRIEPREAPFHIMGGLVLNVELERLIIGPIWLHLHAFEPGWSAEWFR